MSDVGLPSGLVFLIGALLTLAIGAAALVVAMLVGLLSPYEPNQTLLVRAFRFARGPVVCLVVGGLCLALVPVATKLFDDWWFIGPALGVALGGATTVFETKARRAFASRPSGDG